MHTALRASSPHAPRSHMSCFVHARSSAPVSVDYRVRITAAELLECAANIVLAVAWQRMDIEWRSNTRAANARSGRQLWCSCLHEVDGHVGFALDVLNAHLRIGARRRQPLE